MCTCWSWQSVWVAHTSASTRTEPETEARERSLSSQQHPWWNVGGKKESVRQAHSNKLRAVFLCYICEKTARAVAYCPHAHQPPSTAPPRWRRKRCLAPPLPSSGRWTHCPQKKLRSLGKRKSEKQGKGVTSSHHGSPVLRRWSSIHSGLSWLYCTGTEQPLLR